MKHKDTFERAIAIIDAHPDGITVNDIEVALKDAGYTHIVAGYTMGFGADFMIQLRGYLARKPRLLYAKRILQWDASSKRNVAMKTYSFVQGEGFVLAGGRKLGPRKPLVHFGSMPQSAPGKIGSTGPHPLPMVPGPVMNTILPSQLRMQAKRLRHAAQVHDDLADDMLSPRYSGGVYSNPDYQI